MALFELSPIGLIDLIFKFFPDDSQKKQKAAILFRSLYAECVNNIQILNSFKRDSFSKENTMRAVKAIAPLLKNDAGQLILLGTDGSLKELKLMQEQIEHLELELEDNNSQEELHEAKTIRQAISFCVNKIQFLKNYSQIDENNADLFTELTLKTRLNNIYNYSKQIKNQLCIHMSAMFD